MIFRQVERGNVIVGFYPRGPADRVRNRAPVPPAKTLLGLGDMARVVPMLRGAQVIRVWSGIEGYLPDMLPVMGWSRTTKNLLHAFGFCGHGFQLSPGVGYTLAEMIDEGKPRIPIDAFSIDRLRRGPARRRNASPASSTRRSLRPRCARAQACTMKPRASTKRTYYGVPIGILMLDTKFERFNGDIGNAQTWPFPVQYKIVRGAVPNKVVDTLNNRDLFQRFADAADELIAEGVDGITTTCGFLALYQQELAAHCSVPVATSALLQVPMVARMLPKGKRAGDPHLLGRVAHRCIISRRSASIRIRRSSACRRRRSFSARSAKATLRCRSRCSRTKCSASRGAWSKDDPSIGAIVCECTNITPYSHDLNARARRAGVRHGHAGALVSSRAAAAAFPAGLIASGSGLTGGCTRRRPTASSGTPRACAVNSAPASAQKRPWQRPMPQRVIAFRRLTSVGPKLGADRRAQLARRDALAAADHDDRRRDLDRVDRPREGAREAALKAAQPRDLRAA